MRCPNDETEMQPVLVESHYGQPVTIDQCPQCGGIWFDQSELYMVKQGQSVQIEALNSEKLLDNSEIVKANLICPRDQTKLVRFVDPYFPQDIIIERCNTCEGFWLNRGEFTKYQYYRQELRSAKEKRIADKQLEVNLKSMLEQHESGDAVDTLGKLGSFLSTPLDTYSLNPFDSTQNAPENDKALNIIVQVLNLILRVLIRR